MPSPTADPGLRTLKFNSPLRPPMLSLDSFAKDHPELCDQRVLRIPGLKTVKRPGTLVENWKVAYEILMEGDPWASPPIVRNLMQEEGTEAFGFYLSFRADADSWGVYLRGDAIVGLAKEVLRVLNLGFHGLEASVGTDLARQLAFSMAFDLAQNHMAFHGAVDQFTAGREIQDGIAYYATYITGPYKAGLKGSGPGCLEEILANVVALRSFFNPNLAVELGGLVLDALDEEGQFRWNAYLMSGNLTTEMTYILRALPPSYREFGEFFRRRGEVGPYAHMAIQYDLNTEAFNGALRELAKTLLQGKEAEAVEKELLKPAPSRIYLIQEEQS